MIARRVPSAFARLAADKTNPASEIDRVNRPTSISLDSRRWATLLGDSISFVNDTNCRVLPAVEYAVTAGAVGLVFGVQQNVLQSVPLAASGDISKSGW
jgi:hypothetical protein